MYTTPCQHKGILHLPVCMQNKPNNNEQAASTYLTGKPPSIFFLFNTAFHAMLENILTYLLIVTVKKHQQDESFGTFSVTSKMNMFLNSIKCCITGNHIILCKYLIFLKTDALLVQLCHTVRNSETVSSHAIVLQYN